MRNGPVDIRVLFFFPFYLFVSPSTSFMSSLKQFLDNLTNSPWLQPSRPSSHLALTSETCMRNSSLTIIMEAIYFLFTRLLGHLVLLRALKGRLGLPHFTDGESESCGGRICKPSSVGSVRSEPGVAPRLPDSRAGAFDRYLTRLLGSCIFLTSRHRKFNLPCAPFVIFFYIFASA